MVKEFRILILMSILSVLVQGCAGTRPARDPTTNRVSRLPAVEPSYEVRPASVVEAADPPTIEELPRVDDVVDDVPLTLEQFQELALLQNPAVAEAAARVQAIRGKWLQAGLPLNPVIGYSGQQLGSGGEAEQHGVLIGQEFVRRTKRALDQSVAEKEVQQAEQRLAAQRHRLLTDVRIAYYEVLAAQQRTTLNHRIVKVSQDAAKISTDLLKAGDANRLTVIQARLEVENAQMELQNTNNRRIATWRQLSALVGTRELRPQFLNAELATHIPDITWDDARARIMSLSPEVAEALVGVERARGAVDRARVELMPNLDVEGVVQSDNSTGATNGNLVVTIPLPLLNRNQGNIQHARSNLVAAEQAVSRTELELQRRLAIVFQGYENARSQIEQYRRPDGILDNANKTIEMAESLFKADEVNYLVQLTAQRTATQAHLKYLDSLLELWTSIAEIEGLLLRDSLQTAP